MGSLKPDKDLKNVFLTNSCVQRHEKEILKRLRRKSRSPKYVSFNISGEKLVHLPLQLFEGHDLPVGYKWASLKKSAPEPLYISDTATFEAIKGFLEYGIEVLYDIPESVLKRVYYTSGKIGLLKLHEAISDHFYFPAWQADTLSNSNQIHLNNRSLTAQLCLQHPDKGKKKLSATFVPLPVKAEYELCFVISLVEPLTWSNNISIDVGIEHEGATSSVSCFARLRAKSVTFYSWDAIHRTKKITKPLKSSQMRFIKMTVKPGHFVCFSTGSSLRKYEWSHEVPPTPFVRAHLSPRDENDEAVIVAKLQKCYNNQSA